jgi:hypothetical protein
MKEIQGSRIANLNKNNYLFERIYASLPQANLERTENKTASVK